MKLYNKCFYILMNVALTMGTFALQAMDAPEGVVPATVGPREHTQKEPSPQPQFMVHKAEKKAVPSKEALPERSILKRKREEEFVQQEPIAQVAPSEEPEPVERAAKKRRFSQDLTQAIITERMPNPKKIFKTAAAALAAGKSEKEIFAQARQIAECLQLNEEEIEEVLDLVAREIAYHDTQFEIVNAINKVKDELIQANRQARENLLPTPGTSSDFYQDYKAAQKQGAQEARQLNISQDVINDMLERIEDIEEQVKQAAQDGLKAGNSVAEIQKIVQKVGNSLGIGSDRYAIEMAILSFLVNYLNSFERIAQWLQEHEANKARQVVHLAE